MVLSYSAVWCLLRDKTTAVKWVNLGTKTALHAAVQTRWEPMHWFSTATCYLCYGDLPVVPPELTQFRLCVQLHYTTLVYLSLSGMAPADCQLVSDEVRRQLRSVTSRTCVVRRTYSNYGDRCFAAAGPKLWNSLPAELWQADVSFQQFKRLLKTFLFGCWDRGALWLTDS